MFMPTATLTATLRAAVPKSSRTSKPAAAVIVHQQQRQASPVSHHASVGKRTGNDARNSGFILMQSTYLVGAETNGQHAVKAGLDKLEAVGRTRQEERRGVTVPVIAHAHTHGLTASYIGFLGNLQIHTEESQVAYRNCTHKSIYICKPFCFLGFRVWG